MNKTTSIATPSDKSTEQKPSTKVVIGDMRNPWPVKVRIGDMRNPW